MGVNGDETDYSHGLISADGHLTNDSGQHLFIKETFKEDPLHI